MSCVEPSENSKSKDTKADGNVLPRTVVTTDGEVDDMDSFIRMLLYSNEFDIEGLVYSSSQWHHKGDGEGTTFISEMEMIRDRYGERTDLRWPGTTWMQEFIDLYSEVHPNLLLHDEDYPSPDLLRSLIKVGNIDFEGEMEKDTEGVEVSPRDNLVLTASGNDPDDDEIVFRWWQHQDVDSYPGSLKFGNLRGESVAITIPEDVTPGDDFHVILEGTDNGEPPITRYQRIILTVK